MAAVAVAAELNQTAASRWSRARVIGEKPNIPLMTNLLCVKGDGSGVRYVIRDHFHVAYDYQVTAQFWIVCNGDVLASTGRSVQRCWCSR